MFKNTTRWYSLLIAGLNQTRDANVVIILNSILLVQQTTLMADLELSVSLLPLLLYVSLQTFSDWLYLRIPWLSNLRHHDYLMAGKVHNVEGYMLPYLQEPPILQCKSGQVPFSAGALVWYCNTWYTQCPCMFNQLTVPSVTVKVVNDFSEVGYNCDVAFSNVVSLSDV